MPISVVWFQIVSELLVNLSAAGFVAAAVGFVRRSTLQAEEQIATVAGNFVVGLILLMIAFGLRILAT